MVTTRKSCRGPGVDRQGKAVDEVIAVDPSETEVPAGLLGDWLFPMAHLIFSYKNVYC